jgi:hypothetical protein
LTIPDDFNIYSLTDALLKSKSEKSKGTIISRGPLAQLLSSFKENKKQIIWIKDECHKKFENFEKLFLETDLSGNKK